MKTISASTLRCLLLVAGVLTFGISTNLSAQGSGNYCPLSPGYWKNHPGDWPLGSMTLGDQSYSRLDALDLLNLPTTGDASITLANQLIAVLLNIANGSDPSPAASYVGQSQSLLSGYGIRLPYNVSQSTNEGQSMIDVAGQLDRYNNKRMTPHCTPPPTPLPIQLASFTGEIVNGTTILLRWTTLSELNNYGFFVERRRFDDPTFSLVPNSFVPGNGTTTEPQYYSFTDNQVSAGRWYYRLKQIDLDGTVHFTDAILVDIATGVGTEQEPIAFALQQNYPNPFNPSTKIAFQLPTAGNVTLRVVDLLGREVHTLLSGEWREGGTHEIQFDGSRLSSGVYFYEITAGSFHSLRKMALLK